MAGASAAVSAKRVDSALDKLAAKIEQAVERAMDDALDAGLKSLERTKKFDDRSGALRAAFVRFPEGIPTVGRDAGVRVDEAAAPGRRRSARTGRFVPSTHLAPPHVYARFLEWGTSSVAARFFGADARFWMERTFVERLERNLSRAIGAR